MNRQKLRELIPAFARRIAPLYEMLSWKWDKNGELERPDSLDIAIELYRLLDNLEEGGEISTGGLTVSHDKEERVLSIEFTDSVVVCLDE